MIQLISSDPSPPPSPGDKKGRSITYIDLRAHLLESFISYLNHRRGSESDHQNMKTNRELYFQFDNVTWDSPGAEMRGAP